MGRFGSRSRDWVFRSHSEWRSVAPQSCELFAWRSFAAAGKKTSEPELKSHGLNTSRIEGQAPSLEMGRAISSRWLLRRDHRDTMELATRLPAVLAALNAICAILLVVALLAIRRGQRERHRRIMLSNLGVAALFLIAYGSQVVLVGHRRFPGEDWLRTFFLCVLASHTLLAATLLPLVPRTLYLAVRGRFDAHRRLARYTIAIWLYVSFTGVLVFFLHLFRPGG